MEIITEKLSNLCGKFMGGRTLVCILYKTRDMIIIKEGVSNLFVFFVRS